MAYTALAFSCWVGSMMRISAKSTPTNDTNYNCHINAVKRV